MYRKYHKQSFATVKQIRQWYRQGLSQGELAAIFNMCQSNIHYIVTKATWP